MIQISPFKALRPNPGHVQNIISVPYDVISSSEARKIADENRDSFLRVIRSEIDFPENMDPHHESVYERARDNFNRLIDRGLMVREEQPALYLYRLNSDSHEQTGIVCRVSVADYLTGKIKKHELTREEKEADRT